MSEGMFSHILIDDIQTVLNNNGITEKSDNSADHRLMLFSFTISLLFT